MIETTDIINNAKYLLQFQKEELIEELEDAVILEDHKLYCKTIVDEVFRKLFDKGIEESLSADEMVLVDRAIADFTHHGRDRYG